MRLSLPQQATQRLAGSPTGVPQDRQRLGVTRSTKPRQSAARKTGKDNLHDANVTRRAGTVDSLARLV